MLNYVILNTLITNLFYWLLKRQGVPEQSIDPPESLFVWLIIYYMGNILLNFSFCRAGEFLLQDLTFDRGYVASPTKK